MGAGIAHAFLLAGAEAVVVERDQPSVDAARARILRAVEASIERGTTAVPLETLAQRLQVGLDRDVFARVGLAIEAVPEDLVTKHEALRAVEALLPPDACLASNTSSLSIDDLAVVLARPGRFLGLHFFNPVPASSLVEVVTGTATEPGLVAEAQDWVRALGKTPVTVADAPGFASSRLGVMLGLEAIRMLEEGVASAEDIDAAMVLGYRHPMGPLRLTDLVGLDVRLGVAEYLTDRLGPRFEPPELLRRLVAEGKLGRKTGQGFYTWDDAR
jgi:3-hydroxybutyryl-CoA dehydrogenase